jgi:DNA-binding CsgD family transcriptional regulator
MQAMCEMTPFYTSSADSQDFGLTPREREVIALVGAGFTSEDLALKLGISENRANYHLTNVFDKLGVCNCIELLLFAVDQGLIHED